MIEFKVPNIGKAEAWCTKHVGPRLYYIHNRMGGEGWQIKKVGMGPILYIEDDIKATMAMLMLIE